MLRADLWLALVRIVVGAVALATARAKFEVGWIGQAVPFPAVTPLFLAEEQGRLAELAARTPYAWHRDLLQHTVLPHGALAATLEAWAELFVGIGLVLGLLAGLAALLGLGLAGHSALAAHVAGTGPHALHWITLVAMLAFFGARAGRSLGLDGLIRRRVSGVGRAFLALLT